ncbi:MAG TPA: hypothetical protein PL056_09310 [bacterium]|nr:hypothetical protein [bacterium]
MNYDEAIEIVRSSSREDWICESDTNSFTYKRNLCLHIKQLEIDRHDLFNEDWATKHPDKKAYKVAFFADSPKNDIET